MNPVRRLHSALATLLVLACWLPAQRSPDATPDRAEQARRFGRLVGSLLGGRRPHQPARVEPAAANAALDRLTAFAAAVAAPPPRRTPRGSRQRQQAALQQRLDRVATLAERGAALRTVLQAYFAQRSDLQAFRARVDAVCAADRWNGDRPLRREIDVLQLLGMLIDGRRLRSQAVDRVVAHPLASRFPGAVDARAPRVAQTLPIDTAVPRWHSTGMYAAPGEVVEIGIPELPAGVELQAIVGCHTDNIARRDSWQRFPLISRRFTLATAGTHRIANAFGGLIYLASKSRDAGIVRVEVRGAVAAPRFVLGKTTVAEWRQHIRSRAAPFGELACDRLILSLPSAVLRDLDDPEPVLRFWSKVVEVQDRLAGFQRPAPERFVFDRQISAGYMHAGYPLMGPVSAARKALDLETLETKGNWGMFHEIGHNHQTAHFGTYANPWTFDQNIEVTVNIFSAYTYVAALQRPTAMGHQHWRPDILPASLQASFTQAPYGQRSHRERCLFWVHLIREFGWDTLQRVFAAYTRLPRADWPKGDLAKRSMLLRIYSDTVRHDLGPLFAAWGLSTTAEARAAAARHPRYQPQVELPGTDR